LFSRENEDISIHTNIKDETLDAPINLFELQLAVKKLKRKKAPGADGIPNEVWKTLTPTYLEHLCGLFNTTYESGNMPDEWCLVLIQPIFKKVPKEEPNNYRPIANSTTTNVGLP